LLIKAISSIYNSILQMKTSVSISVPTRLRYTILSRAIIIRQA